MAVFALTYWRLFHGVDFTDEAWYVGVALPLRARRQALRRRAQRSADHRGDPALPARVDLPRDRRAQRNRAVCPPRPLPPRSRRRVRGVRVAAPPRGAGGRGVRGGLAAFTFVPFNIPSVSYDSLGSGLFTAGTLLGLLALAPPPGGAVGGALPRARRVRLPAVDPRGRRDLRAAAVAHAHQLARGRPRRSPRRRWGSRWLAFAALAAARRPPPDDHRLPPLVTLTSVRPAASPSSTAIAAHLKDTLPLWYLLAAGLLLLVWSWPRWPRIAAATVALLPLADAPDRADALRRLARTSSRTPAGSRCRCSSALRRPRRRRVELFVAVWLPAVIGGVITAYTAPMAASTSASASSPRWS